MDFDQIYRAAGAELIMIFVVLLVLVVCACCYIYLSRRLVR